MTTTHIRRTTVAAGGMILAIGASLLATPTPSIADPADAPQPLDRTEQACDVAPAGHARCLAMIRTDVVQSRANSLTAVAPRGFGPADLQSAYNLPTSGGAGQTIAIVAAYDSPTAEADLNVYRETFGQPACTTANGCFTKLNQRGEEGNYPYLHHGWAVEISLDLDMASASCPKCNIMLVEADNSSLDNLAIAVDTAVAAGADVVTNSYGIPEDALARYADLDTYFDHYRHEGTAIVAASGDWGFTQSLAPSVFPGVISVGGTSLYAADTSRGWTERAWNGAGSGCSAYVAKPRYQKDSRCRMRTTADISAVADPDTGVAIYDSTPNPYGLPAGWLVIGGTSAASPLVAGMIGLAGNASTLTPEWIYRHKSSFHDVIGGSNGECGGDYLCTAKRGYDGPTGLGTPNGVGGL